VKWRLARASSEGGTRTKSKKKLAFCRANVVAPEQSFRNSVAADGAAAHWASSAVD